MAGFGHFMVSNEQLDIANGATVLLLFRTSATKLLEFNMSFSSSAGGLLRMYDSPTITNNGTIIPIINMNRPAVAVLSDSSCYLSPIVTANGLRLMSLAPSNSFDVMDTRMILALNIYYLFSFTARSGKTDVILNFDFLEGVP